uniref:AA_permease domain-containing protein n=1 Tax=Panagrellus redivivus TaxID=6233 RepID=A0A7E4UPJ2_PANRE
MEENKMGYLGATSYVIGNIIGSGVFITPASIYRATDSVGISLVIWLVCAVIALLGALCYIELGTSIREAGCDFAYICYVKWYSIAFSFMWVSVLMTYPATIAIVAETFGQYLVEGIKQYIEITDDVAPTVQKMFGFALLLVVAWMNFFELNTFAARFQVIATVAKLLSCGLIVVVGMYYYFFKDITGSALADPWPSDAKWTSGSLVVGFYGGLYAYSGWDILNYGTGEITNPRRNVPLALLSGIGVVTGIYFFINIAFFAVLDIDTMKNSAATAAVFSERTMGAFSAAIPFLIGILLLGSLNSNLFSASRYMYAAAKQGHLPACFSCVNPETDSPRVAVFAQTALAMAITFVGDLDSLIGYVIFGFWAQRIFTLVALLVIRYKAIPVHADALRIPLWVILLFLVINIILVIIPIFQEFHITALGIGICLVGFGFYFVLVYPTTLPMWMNLANQRSTFWTSIVFDALPDLKAPPPLVSSDSSAALLAKRPSFSIASEDSVPDLHSDEKNTLIRNSSSTGLRMW